MACKRQIDLQFERFLCKEIMRHLDQNARSVTGLGIGAGCAPVAEPAQSFQRLRDDARSIFCPL